MAVVKGEDDSRSSCLGMCQLCVCLACFEAPVNKIRDLPEPANCTRGYSTARLLWAKLEEKNQGSKLIPRPFARRSTTAQGYQNTLSILENHGVWTPHSSIFFQDCTGTLLICRTLSPCPLWASCRRHFPPPGEKVRDLLSPSLRRHQPVFPSSSPGYGFVTSQGCLLFTY
jgi:hypothetical protein